MNAVILLAMLLAFYSETIHIIGKLIIINCVLVPGTHHNFVPISVYRQEILRFIM